MYIICLKDITYRTFNLKFILDIVSRLARYRWVKLIACEVTL